MRFHALSMLPFYTANAENFTASLEGRKIRKLIDSEA